MKTNWGALAHEAKNYLTKVPAPWTPVAVIAREMGVSENRVRAKLAPAMAQRLVAQRFFMLFDPKAGFVKRVSAYRDLTRKQKKPPTRKA